MDNFFYNFISLLSGNSTNDQLLEKCNQFMNLTHEPEDKHDDSTDDSVSVGQGSALAAAIYSAANALNSEAKNDEISQRNGNLNKSQCPECGKHVRKRKWKICIILKRILGRVRIDYLVWLE